MNLFFFYNRQSAIIIHCLALHVIYEMHIIFIQLHNLFINLFTIVAYIHVFILKEKSLRDKTRILGALHLFLHKGTWRKKYVST